MTRTAPSVLRLLAKVFIQRRCSEAARSTTGEQQLPDPRLAALIRRGGRWVAQGPGDVIKVCPQNVIFQRGARAGSGTDDGSSVGGTKHGSVWERRDEGLRAAIPPGEVGRSEVKGR